jgi:hypothetical protein
MPLVSIVQDTYGKEKLPRSFEEMQKHGLKIASYTTTEVRR